MKLYIIPGYEETKRKYQWLILAGKVRGYDVEFLNLQLKANLLSELSKTMIDENSVVFGFSTGALIAYKLKSPVKKGLYCSMSELLSNDPKNAVSEMKKLFAKNVIEEFKKMRYGKPKAESFVQFCGELEISPRVFKLGPVTIIPKTGHRLTKAYREAILKEL